MDQPSQLEAYFIVREAWVGLLHHTKSRFNKQLKIFSQRFVIKMFSSSLVLEQLIHVPAVGVKMSSKEAKSLTVSMLFFSRSKWGFAHLTGGALLT